MSDDGALTDLSAAQFAVLEDVYQDEWAKGSLAVFAAIDRPLHRRGIDAQSVLLTLVPTFVHRRGSGPKFQPAEELALTVRGLAQTTGSAVVAPYFLRALSFLVAAEEAHDIADQGLHPQATSSDLTDLFSQGRPRQVAASICNQLCLLLAEEQYIWNGISRADDGRGDWTFTLSREIRRFRDVLSIDDYLAVAGAGVDMADSRDAVVVEEGGEVLSADPQRVFVVHGRNRALRDAMFTFLHSIGLRPIEWDEAVAMTRKGAPYIGEVLDVAFDAGQAIVVLLTPDDVAYIRRDYASGDDDPDLEPLGQARPNVLFEAGMAIGRNANRTILVEIGDLRPFSDVGGRHAIRMDNDPHLRMSLADRLATAGCPVVLDGNHWMSAGDFTPPRKPGAGLPLGRRIPTIDRTGAHVDGHWYASGSNKFDQVRVTNNGAVPILEVQLLVPDELSEHIRLTDSKPVAKLPVGKSFTVKGWTTNRTMQGGAPNQFELKVVGNLDDGSLFEQDVYFDSGS